MSLEGYVAGPGDGKANPLGAPGWYGDFRLVVSRSRKVGDTDIFHPEPGTDQAVVEEMFEGSRAFDASCQTRREIVRILVPAGKKALIHSGSGAGIDDSLCPNPFEAEP